MRLGLLALLCVIVLSAGCNGFSGTAEPTGTVTPAPVPAQPTEEIGHVLPSGLSAGNVTDVDRLVEQHEAVLEDTSYRWEGFQREATPSERNSTGEDGNYTSSTARVINNGTTTYRASEYEQVIDGQTQRRSARIQYTTAGRLYIARQEGVDAEREYDVVDASSTRYLETTGTDGIREYLDLETARVYRNDVGNRTHFTVVGSKDAVRPYGSVENYTARAIVRDDGLVRELRVQFNISTNGVHRHVEYESSFSDVGTADVPEPDWLDRARAAQDD